MAGVEDLRELALALPEAVEGTSYGTLAFRVRRSGFARLLEDGERVVIRMNRDEREAALASRPDLFELTPHYEAYPRVLVRLAAADREELAALLLASWRRAAPARLVAAHDAGRAG